MVVDLKMDKLAISVLGKTNSGKGVLLDGLREHYDGKRKISILSLGNTIRQIDFSNPFGQEMLSYLKCGMRLPPEAIRDLIHRAAGKLHGDVVFLDGFPPEYTEKIFGQLPNGMLVLLADNALCLERSRNRVTCDTCNTTFQKSINLSVGRNCLKCNGKLEHRCVDTDEIMYTRLETFDKNDAPEIARYEIWLPTCKIKIQKETTRQQINDQAVQFLGDTFGFEKILR